MTTEEKLSCILFMDHILNCASTQAEQMNKLNEIILVVRSCDLCPDRI